MSHPARAYLTLTLLLTVAVTDGRGQTIYIDGPPTPFQPKQPPGQKELGRHEAHRLYGLALIQQREDRIVEAARTLEEARELDPDAAAVPKALVPYYLALCRLDDALNACQAALDLDPGDYELWYLYARQLRDQARPKDALAALERGTACAAIKESPDLLVQMHYDRGVLHEELRQLAEAEAAFTEAVRLLERPEMIMESGPFNREQINAEAARTYERIGKVCIQAGHPDRAETAFRKAQAKDPVHAERLNFNLAEVCRALKKPADALQYLDRYLQEQPPGTEAYEMRIELLKQLGREADILPSLRQLADRDEHNTALQLLLARQYAVADQRTEAERRFLKLTEESPQPDVYRGLFSLYKEQRRLDKVLDQVDRSVTAGAVKGDDTPGDAAAVVRARSMLLVLRDEPELVQAVLTEAVLDLRLGRDRSAETRRLLAVLAGRTRQFDAAEKLYRDCLRRLTPAAEGEVYAGLLEVLWEERKYDDIVRLCQQGLEQAQASGRALFYVNLANALAQQAKFDEAVAAADEAVKLAEDRNRLRLRRIRVDVLRQAGRIDDAVEECRVLLKQYTQPGEVRDIRYSLSSVYTEAKEQVKAEAELRRILEIDPNDVVVNNDLGYALADQGRDLEEAERLIRKAVTLDEEAKKHGGKLKAEDEGEQANAAYLDSLGWVLFRRGQLDEAREWLEKASQMPGGSDDPVIWDHLGDVYTGLDRPAQAQTAWQKAIRLYEVDKRRKPDEHYQGLKNKLKNMQP